MEEKIKKILSELTIEEKAGLCSGKDMWYLEGIERLNLPSIMVTDGPHGLRKQMGDSDHLGLSNSVKATCFPTASALASTWDNELVYQVGEKLGDECLTEDVSVILGPGINIKRHPLCGRNFEYFSEDPYLSGKLASSLIKGIQSKGIGTSVKHYVANNQESMRMVLDTFIDERTLREIYLKGFEIAVKEAQPWTVMCSYNKINGTYVSENKKILNDILKEEWGHKGIVVTDWGATNNRVAGLKAGQELQMPGTKGIHDAQIVKAIKQGNLSEELLDQRVKRVLELIMKADVTLKKEKKQYNKDEHHNFARKAASEAIVLLQNENSFLPLEDNVKTALIGEFAVKPRYQGSGSSLINPNKIVTAHDAFKNKLGDNFVYAKGYDVSTDIIDDKLINEAVLTASKVKNVVLMVGLTEKYESEGFDRKHLNIPANHLKLIEEVSKVNKNIVVCLSNGAPIIMPWRNSVHSIVEQYLGGQASGEALCDIIFGDVNPSGKLAETFPNNIEEFPANQNFLKTPKQVEYREGLYVGYRYYDSVNKEPLFPFGFGLSYTSYEYSDLIVDKNSPEDKEIIVSFTITNTGNITGKEIVQLYVSKSDSMVYRPQSELKEYTKIELEPKESKKVTLTIPYNSLAIYNNGFKVEGGDYYILINSSSKDNQLKTKVTIQSNDKMENENNLSYLNIDDTFNPTKEDFELMYNDKILEYPQTTPYHLNSTLGDIKNTFVGKRLFKMVNKQFQKMVGDEIDESMKRMVESMIDELPFRGLVMLSNGSINDERAEGLLLMMNKKPLRGLIKVIKG